MSRQETTPNAIPQPEQSLAPAGAFPRPPQPEAALHVLNTVPQPATMPSGVPYGLPGPHDAIMPQTSIPPGVLPTSSISVALPSYGTLIHGNKILRDEQPPKFGQGSFRMLPYDTVPKGDPTRKWLTIGVPSTMNKVIFDYLITQGYPAAAARFAKEAGIPQPQAEDALDRIEERKNIRLAILKGEIESAIYQINDYDAKVRHFIPLSSYFREFANCDDEANVHAPLLHPSRDAGDRQPYFSLQSEQSTPSYNPLHALHHAL